MEELTKGLSCRSCQNCLTRTFRNSTSLTDWLEKKGVLKLSVVLKCWAKSTRGKNGLVLYWCKLESPIGPTSTPPWWGKHSVLGCLNRV